jgi:sterol desaturase/sphingolipid hydroxylase (fatty acid hydroxylase superfamily)
MSRSIVITPFFVFQDVLQNLFVDHALATQAFLFVTIIVGLWLIEKAISTQPWRHKWSHSSVNVLLVLAALPVQVAMAAGISWASNLVTGRHWGLIEWMPKHSIGWVRVLCLFVLLDFCDYLYHRSMHAVRGFWRFHRVHHSDQQMDVSTTVREHPGETLVRNLFLILWIFVCGASFGVLVLRQTFQTVFNILQHTQLRLPRQADRILGWIFITPNLHHVHHHYELPHTDRNFGDVFSIWDRLFGTFAELSLEETVFGLDTHMDEAKSSCFLHVAKMPFQSGTWRSE